MSGAELMMHGGALATLPEQVLSAAVVVVFGKSSSRNYAAALQVARQASCYTDHCFDGQPLHVAAFSKTPRQLAAASALLRYVANWSSSQVLCMGRYLVNLYLFDQVVTCSEVAACCRDPRAHCLQVEEWVFDEDRPLQSGSISIKIRMPNEIPVQDPEPEKPESYLTPCRRLRLRGRLSRRHPSSAVDQIEALAKTEIVDVCPFFNSNEFRMLDNKDG